MCRSWKSPVAGMPCELQVQESQLPCAATQKGEKPGGSARQGSTSADHCTNAASSRAEGQFDDLKELGQLQAAVVVGPGGKKSQSG